VDALICGEGDGPIANLPRWCGCILASPDPVATDVTIARLMGHDPEKLNSAREAEARGLGVREPIEYVGAPLEQVAFPAWPGHTGYDYLPINFIVGKGATLEGTIGHVKSILDSMLWRGELNQVIAVRGTPTVMIGEAEDPHFEEHLREGPYVVIDDTARPEYRNDPRVHFVPGHPVLRDAIPGLLEGLAGERLADLVPRWEQFKRREVHNVKYGTPKRRALTLAGPLAMAGLCAAAAFLAVRKMTP
jgi:hypothetical protein